MQIFPPSSYTVFLRNDITRGISDNSRAHSYIVNSRAPLYIRHTMQVAVRDNNIVLLRVDVHAALKSEIQRKGPPRDL